jgi:pimeloyl-ACP methyl ester carboxylesterase
VAPERIERFKNGKLTFEVIDSGPLDGTPVILLHGFPQRATAWTDVAARLHEAGLRTFALDQRGYSPGARPRSRFAYRISSLVSDIKALIDEIGTPVHIAGHDWGAAVSWATAAHHPDVVRSVTAASVGHPRAFLRAMLTSSQIRMSYYIGLFQLPLLAERTLSAPGARGEEHLMRTGLPEDLLPVFRREMIGDGALRGGLGWYRSMPLMSFKDLARVVVPATLVWSRDDTALGRRMAELTEKYVDGPYEFIELTGSHWVLNEQPDVIAEAIIKRVASAS